MTAPIVVLAGPPGAGKSTTARSYAQSLPLAVHLHTDDFWHMIVAGSIPPYLPESDAQNQTVLGVIRAAAEAYARGGFTVVVDGIVGPWMLRHFDDVAVPLHYIVLRPSRAEALRRAQARTAADALVDEGPILSMWDQLADLGSLEGHAIDTTDQTPAQTLTRVQEAVESGTFSWAAKPSAVPPRPGRSSFGQSG
ncbi:AAA family ATPase [Epidermidibacterium keratini]|uniref:AAA family ATPase n=1 Tax=Epidermidibacterium keratini TaxID=1891644 RepID=A0A7M3T541_9ACTN|nr:ATP-binding protein [Epidermidibacterium keratini]QHB98905.1 AAA family ATPase [Epidermidibacterium keratini]